MPLFMLDTNMCIYLMKNQPEQVPKNLKKTKWLSFCFVVSKNDGIASSARSWHLMLRAATICSC